VRRHIVTETVQRRAAPGRAELHRLRAGVFRLGGFVGLDTRSVLRFSEVISGRRWRRCGSADLEQVVADFAQLANRLGPSARSDARPDPEQEPGGPRR
jgi:hypothetical protein